MPTLHLALVALLLLACGAAIAQHRWPFAGWLLGALIGVSLHALTPTVAPVLPAPELAHFVGLPPLLFATAWQLDGRLARTQLSPVLLVAVFGTALAIATIGSALVYLSPLSLANSLLLGAALAATSPNLLAPLLAAAGVPRSWSALLAGESTLNQLLAVLSFSAIANLAVSTDPMTAWQRLLWELTAMGLGGLLLGSGSGLLLYFGLQAAKSQPYVQVALTLAATWLVFGIATHLHVSGAITVVLLGLVASWQAARQLSPSNRESISKFWAYLTDVISLLACLLAGWAAATYLDSLDAWFTFSWLLAVVVLASALARASTVYLLVPLANSLRQVTPLDWRVQTVLWASGARSSVALVLLFSLELASDAPRNLLLALALGVLLLTTGVARGSLSSLARYLELTPPALATRMARLQARLTARREALQQFSDLDHFEPWTGAALAAIAQDYSEAVYQAEQSLTALWTNRRLPTYDRQQVLWLHALNLEITGYRYLYDRGLLSEPILTKLELRITLRRDAVLQGFMPPPFFTLRTSAAQWQLALARARRGAAGAQRLRQQAALAKYEADAAIACVCAQVAQTLERSLEDRRLEVAIAADCAASYREDGQIAHRNLTAAADQEAAQVRAQQRRILQRVATLSEQDALEQLVRDGTLSAALLRQLRTGA